MKRTKMSYDIAVSYEELDVIGPDNTMDMSKTLANEVEKIFPFSEHGKVDDLCLSWTLFVFRAALQARLELCQSVPQASAGRFVNGDYGNATFVLQSLLFVDYILIRPDGFVMSTSDSVFTDATDFAKLVIASMKPCVKNPYEPKKILYKTDGTLAEQPVTAD